MREQGRACARRLLLDGCAVFGLGAAVTIAAVVGQHAEEAAFQWLLRDSAVSAPHYDLADLAKLDGRVEAHIDGLRIAGDEGWNLCAEALERQEAGEVFAAGVLALKSKDQSRLEKVFAVAQEEPRGSAVWFPLLVGSLRKVFVAPLESSSRHRTLSEDASELLLAHFTVLNPKTPCGKRLAMRKKHSRAGR